MTDDDKVFTILLEFIKLLAQLVFLVIAFLLGRYSKKG